MPRRFPQFTPDQLANFDKSRDMLRTPEGRAKAIPALKSAMTKRAEHNIQFRYQLADGTFSYTADELAAMEAGGDGRVPYRVKRALAANKRLKPGMTIIQDIVDQQFRTLTEELRGLLFPEIWAGRIVQSVRDVFPVYRERVDGDTRILEFRDKDWPEGAGWLCAHDPILQAPSAQTEA